MATITGARLRRKVEKLKERVLALGTRVEEAVQKSVKAIKQRDAALAAEVIDGDREIDTMEVDLEEDCLEVLALHQPVAQDLRFIIGILKINSDLERIGDYAVNIAETATHLASESRLEIPDDYFVMAGKTQSMLKTSLDAFVTMSADMAYRILAEDDEVDFMRHTLHRDFEERVTVETDHRQPLIHLFLVSRHLERIADQATNIAEDVIYMTTGAIVRHGGRNDNPRAEK